MPQSEIPQLFAEPREIYAVKAGATFVHTIDTYTCKTPAPQTRCPCGYYQVEWVMLQEEEGRDAHPHHS